MSRPTVTLPVDLERVHTLRADHNTIPKMETKGWCTVYVVWEGDDGSQVETYLIHEPRLILEAAARERGL